MAAVTYICGPHGAGKTTLVERLIATQVAVQAASLAWNIPENSAYERASIRATKYRLEQHINSMRVSTSGESPCIGDRCIYDTLSYTEAYVTLGWMGHEEATFLKSHIVRLFADCRFPSRLVLLLPTVSVLRERLRKRFQNTGVARWRHDDDRFLACLRNGYEVVFGGIAKCDADILWLRDGSIEAYTADVKRFLWDGHDGS